MNYCTNCGNELHGEKICSKCGAKVDAVTSGLTEAPIVKKPDEFTVTGSKCCPKCGGNHLQVVNESNTTGGGYSASNGCCGYMLFGPLGLLCGACGNKTKTTNKTYFVCMDCGNKFAK